MSNFSSGGDPLLLSLARALVAQSSPWAHAPLERLKDKGLAHDHVRLCGTGLLARIPKQSQMRLGAQDNLAYQSACFERAAAGGHAPQLQGVLPPCANLPRGALLVEEIVGHNAVLPNDLGSIVRALAAIHGLPLPDAIHRYPLINAQDPLKALLDEIADQSQHVAAARLDAPVSAAVMLELNRLRSACQAPARPPRHLIAFDGHPGNFIIRAGPVRTDQGVANDRGNDDGNYAANHEADPAGNAVLVDLEKCRYSYPGLDLAHATLYTSTTWDIDSHAVLSLADILDAYQTWAQCMPQRAAMAALAWHVPLRRAMWLWSITWCAKWRVVSTSRSPVTPDGEDWSEARSDEALIRHVRNRVDHYLSPAIVMQVREEFDQLDAALGCSA